MSEWQPGEKQPDTASMLRVNQAGEYGAARIYAGQLAVLGRGSPAAHQIARMAAQEQRHLDRFNELMAEHRASLSAVGFFLIVGAAAIELYVSFPSAAARGLQASVVEQVLENARTATAWRFRYVVWGYTTLAARPLRYGLGDFEYVAEDDRTRLTWTYSFELRPDAFPGFLGVGLGGALLKLAFLGGPYATWMKAGLAAIKEGAEAS